MDSKLEAKIFHDFPEFFKHASDIKNSAMCWGMECHDGWYELIYQLCADINVELIKEYGEIPEWFYVVQIKEKWATLRYSLAGGTKNIHALILRAEKQSAKICEECGAPGTLECRGFWLKTVCTKCAKVKGFIDCPQN